MSPQQLDEVGRALRGEFIGSEELTGPHRRLVDALNNSAQNAGPADIAALLHQVLRHEDLRHNTSVHLDIPLTEALLSRSALELSGLQAMSLGASRVRVSATPVAIPDWLSGPPHALDLSISSPFGVSAGTNNVPSWSRPETPVPIDPALSDLTHLREYRSQAQATAIRTVALAPPGATVHVVLPTGVGKSLVGTAPGLLTGDGTTVVVVPTVALAMDQERAARRLFPGSVLPEELAYYGDRDPSEKELMRRRLALGTQRLIFCSPEAMIAGLSPSLHQLARRGGLRFFVVDEAHLVRTWGLSFRPEFQLVGALRTELANTASAAGHPAPVTALMTATLSREALALNDALFGGHPTALVASSFLRSEPRYLIGVCDNEEQRRDRLIEVLRLLPRPAIVYTTRPRAAEALADRALEAGFGRVAVFHGETDASRRKEVLGGWTGQDAETTIDVVFGTSAFGLGVDQSDVRSVVHACVPGSVDRFYQEVGRSGRDGHASVAVWLPVVGPDLREAMKIESSTVIGDEKAWSRWKAMRSSAPQATLANPDALVVDTTAVPRHVTDESDKNRLWNRNTLILFERAGLINLVTLPPPEREKDESQEAWEARQEIEWERFRSTVGVQLQRDAGNFDRTTVDERLNGLRSAILQDEASARARLESLLACQACWGEAISTEYRYEFTFPGDSNRTVRQEVASSCSGCPAQNHRGPVDGRAPVPVVPTPRMDVLDMPLRDGVRAQLHNRGALVVGYSSEQSLLHHLDDLIRRCVTSGIRAIYARKPLIGHEAIGQAHRWAKPQGFVIVEEGVPRLRPFSVPSVVVCLPGDPIEASWLPPSFVGSARVIVAPHDAQDPDRPSETISAWRAPSLMLEDFLRRI